MIGKEAFVDVYEMKIRDKVSPSELLRGLRFKESSLLLSFLRLQKMHNKWDTHKPGHEIGKRL